MRHHAVQGAGTSSAVFLELHGSSDASSGEHRLVVQEGGGLPFQRGATDRFQLQSARDLAPPWKVGVPGQLAGNQNCSAALAPNGKGLWRTQHKELRLAQTPGATLSAYPAALPCEAQVRVYHDSSGPSPAWFLEEVRVRRAGGDGHWTLFPCGRWLAVDQEDG